ncbi:CBS domain-containing protein [Mycolicibacterium pulveris]|uniref:Signal transduction protein n=1 Tax=Mycolicibacterium pulveris TaxID=36813 RepID=A0A7I7UNH5_MYCPV|nr:CBS domain-containing protein [Mycolicibacterium pulveris]MCV6983135.1 CBS domain-containing protein [Mycolicibacterium pulveris]BBY83002.1 signal transduction protein [Mycolicibacterium pulveris]
MAAIDSTPVSTVIGDPVARIPADATIADAAKALAEGEFGAVVVGDEESPVALLSERDVMRVVASGQDPAAVRARDVAAKDLVWCDANATVQEVAIRMMDRYIRHILVKQDGKLAGIVSARDLLGVYCSDTDLD